MSRYVRVVEISRGYIPESIWLQAALGWLPPFTSEVPMTAATESSHCPRTFEKVRSTP